MPFKNLCQETEGIFLIHDRKNFIQNTGFTKGFPFKGHVIISSALHMCFETGTWNLAAGWLCVRNLPFAIPVKIYPNMVNLHAFEESQLVHAH